MNLRSYRRQCKDAFEAMQRRRLEALVERDYIDHEQWNDHEKQVLSQRNQHPVVVNFLKKKLEFLFGIEIRSRTDPKAYPRTPQHEADAEAYTRS